MSTDLNTKKLSQLKKKQIKVQINGKTTELDIGDKVVFPEDTAVLRTVTNMIISEDGSVNYIMKHWRDDQLVSETFSVYDLVLLNCSRVKANKISINPEET